MNKTVIVADSHAKLASFITWLASTERCERKTINFSATNKIGNQIIDYVDFQKTGNMERVIGIELDSLREPIIYPLVKRVNTVAFLVSRKRTNDESTMADISIKEGLLLSERPRVYCIFNDGTQNQKEKMKTTLLGIGIHAEYPGVDLSDFKKLWTHLSSPKSSTVLPAQSERETDPVSLHPTAKAAIKVLTITLGKSDMANITESLNDLMQISGALGCFVADYTSGMVLAKAGAGLNLDVAGAGNTEVIKAKMKTMVALGLKDSIEDILITLGTQYHIMRPMASKPGLFLYLALDKSKSNLAMARFKLLDVEKTLIL